jgi:23S rRNA pseudouridine1911/1915/1917 synthase
LTGRTHQIRVHLASIGHPCLGDPLYGGRQGKIPRGKNLQARNSQTKPAAGLTDDLISLFGRQALHALALRLSQPRTAAALEFVASPPQDLVDFLAARGIATGRAELERWIELASLPLVERPGK